MTRKELKMRAKAQLGNGIFTNNWMLGVLVAAILDAILVGAGAVIPGIGALLVSGAVSYSGCWMFLKQTRDGQKMDLHNLLVGFDNFGRNFLLGLLSGLFEFLWGLLLVVPGIVKAYSYSMAFYLVSDYDELDWNAALKNSIRLMKGHKMELFILDLSFIGWYIIGALALGVGTFWVNAYHRATRAQFYEDISRGFQVDIPQTVSYEASY